MPIIIHGFISTMFFLADHISWCCESSTGTRAEPALEIDHFKARISRKAVIPQEENNMLNLENMETGSHCTIAWLPGRMGEYMRSACGFNEDDNLGIILNYGDGTVLAAHGGKRCAMSPDASHAVKVQPVRCQIGAVKKPQI